MFVFGLSLHMCTHIPIYDVAEGHWHTHMSVDTRFVYIHWIKCSAFSANHLSLHPYIHMYFYVICILLQPPQSTVERRMVIHRQGMHHHDACRHYCCSDEGKIDSV
jgi:hypothetical protein